MYHWHNYSQNQKVLRSSTKLFLLFHAKTNHLKPATRDPPCCQQHWVAMGAWSWQKQNVYSTRIKKKTKPQQYLEFFFLIHPFQKSETQEEQPWWNPSAALRAEMRWLWPFCQHSFILTTRQHLCHSVWAASQHYGNFKAQCHHLNVCYSSLPRQDLLQHQTRDMKRMKQKTVGWNRCQETWKIPGKWIPTQRKITQGMKIFQRLFFFLQTNSYVWILLCFTQTQIQHRLHKTA